MIDSLTGVRAVAVFWVMMLHFGRMVKWPHPFDRIAALGATRVSLFFVLSGFVLTVNFLLHFSQRPPVPVAGLRPGSRRPHRAGLHPGSCSWPGSCHALGPPLLYAAQYAASINPSSDSLKNVLGVFPLPLLAVNSWVPLISVTDLWNAAGWGI